MDILNLLILIFIICVVLILRHPRAKKIRFDREHFFQSNRLLQKFEADLYLLGLNPENLWNLHHKNTEQFVLFHGLVNEIFIQSLTKTVLYYSLCLICRIVLTTYFQPILSNLDYQADNVLVISSLIMGAIGTYLNHRNIPPHWYLKDHLTKKGEQFIKSILYNETQENEWSNEWRQLEIIEMTSGTSMSSEKISLLKKWSEVLFYENKNQLQVYRLQSSFNEFIFAAISSLFIVTIPAIMIILQTNGI